MPPQALCRIASPLRFYDLPAMRFCDFAANHRYAFTIRPINSFCPLAFADLAVVTVSVDRKGIDAVRKVFAELDVQKLPIYIDRSGEALRTVRAMGLPTSLLIDREGREFGRAVGPAQWDSAATIAFFRHAVLHESQTDGRSDRIYIDPNR